MPDRHGPAPDGSDRILALLEESGALRRGHFLLSSGLHSPGYVQCALLLQRPERCRQVAGWLADLLRPLAPGSVLSPALGGVLIGHEVAAALGVDFRFCERVGSELALRRGFSLPAGERVVIVEDVVTTGKSTRETAALVTGFGGEVVGFGSIIDRSGGRHGFEQPFCSLAELTLDTWPATSCPLCAAGSVAEKPGSRPQPVA